MIKLGNYIYDCSNCPTRCDGNSKRVYNFINDVEYSEKKENELIDTINQIDGFMATKCIVDGYPDIEVFDRYTNKVFYIEIKAQRRTFMSVKRILPYGELEPSETLALNLSDLVRYFNFLNEDQIRIFILWCVENRPCIVPENRTRYFYQDAFILERIYHHYGDSRRFRRASGFGDVVDGKHKGVVVNYHFSLAELKELDLNEILAKGIE